MTTTTTTTTNYGQLLDPATVRFERVLPGPIERVWDYLTVSEKRAKWLASGEIDLRVGGTGTLTFKNAELSSIVEETPAEYRQDHDCGIDQPIRVTQIEKPRLLAFVWGSHEDDGAHSEAVFELTEKGKDVILTLTHRKLVNRAEAVSISGGWHTHLAILEEVLEEQAPQPFWSRFLELNAYYKAIIPE